MGFIYKEKIEELKSEQYLAKSKEGEKTRKAEARNIQRARERQLSHDESARLHADLKARGVPLP